MKHVTMLDWSKKQLVEAVEEERAMKQELARQRDLHIVEKEHMARAARSDLQSLQAKLEAANARAIKEQGRADSAEAALLRAHKALVTAVERLGAR